MADERDPKVSQRYRELADEEPPRELDRAILAAARRSMEKPHAPLVTPSGRHRWYFSLGAAAVIVLAVGVTYHMQREQPDPDSVGVPPAPAAKPETASKPAPVVTPDRKARAPERAAEVAREPAAPPPPVIVPDPRPQKQEGRRELAREAPGARSDSAGAAVSPARPMQAPVVETPERMLERIAELRKAGKHEEADRLLAEFRQRYPNHEIPAAAKNK
jgi:hypothetical protein